MKFKINPIVSIGIFIGMATILLAPSSGQNSAYAGHPNDNGTCATCHGGGNLGGSIALTGAPSNYTLGASYPMSLTITDVEAMRGGFQIVAVSVSPVSNAQIGTFTTTPAPDGTRLTSGANAGRLVQTDPKPFNASDQVTWNFNWVAPLSGAPSQVAFYYVGNAAAGSAGTDGDDIYSGVTAGIPLPIELADFGVRKGSKSTNELHWTTNTEVNTQSFKVERSINGRDFVTVGVIKVAGKTASANEYVFRDDSYLKLYNYYRLSIVDFDGKTEYSEIVSIDNTLVSDNYYRLNGRELQFYFNDDGAKDIQIINTNGKVVSKSNIANAKEASINIDNLPFGLYFIYSNSALLGKVVL